MPLPAPTVRVAAGLTLLALTTALSSCASGDTTFDPAGGTAASGRTAIKAEVDRTMRVLTGGVPTLARARFDVCSKGREDQKEQDRYARSCAVIVSRIVPGAANVDEVSASLAELDSALTNIGCSSDLDESLMRIEGDQWQAQLAGGNPNPGALPGARYECDGHRVEIEPVGQKPSADELAVDKRLVSGVSDQVMEGHPYKAGTSFSEDAGAFAYMITVADDYYFIKF